MTQDAREIHSYLEGVDYPATKDELITTAEANDAPDEVIARLQATSGEQFEDPEELTVAIGDA
ncbi:MAG: DUF2795 domain-containing protein [Thermoleophilaceae bacterium]